MNSTVRPKVFEFSKTSAKNAKALRKSPNHLRIKTQLTLSKLKFSLEYDQNLLSTSNPSTSPMKNIGLIFSNSKKCSNLSVCEVNELPSDKLSEKVSRVMKKPLANQYFNKEKIRTKGYATKTHSKVFLNEAHRGMKSLRNITDLFSSHSNTHTSSNTFRLRDQLLEAFARKSKSRSIYVAKVPKPSFNAHETMQNCVCIQTEDFSAQFEDNN